VSLLTLTEIESSLKYKSEREASTSSVLPLYVSSPPTLPPLSLSPIPINSSLLYNISQHNSLEQILFQLR